MAWVLQGHAKFPAELLSSLVSLTRPLVAIGDVVEIKKEWGIDGRPYKGTVTTIHKGSDIIDKHTVVKWSVDDCEYMTKFTELAILEHLEVVWYKEFNVPHRCGDRWQRFMNPHDGREYNAVVNACGQFTGHWSYIEDGDIVEDFWQHGRKVCCFFLFSNQQ